MNDVAEALSPPHASRTLNALLAQAFEPALGWKQGRGHSWFNRTTRLYKLEFYGRVPSWSFEFGLHLHPKYPATMKQAVSVMAGFALEVDLKRLADAHGLPLSLEYILAGGQNQYTMLTRDLPLVERSAAELAAVLAHALPMLTSIDTWQALDHWANRVPDAECPFRFLRRPINWTPMNSYADIAIAKAANAPDFADRASERLARYRAHDTPMVQYLEAFVSACGLPA